METLLKEQPQDDYLYELGQAMFFYETLPDSYILDISKFLDDAATIDISLLELCISAILRDCPTKLRIRGLSDYVLKRGIAENLSQIQEELAFLHGLIVSLVNEHQVDKLEELSWEEG